MPSGTVSSGSTPPISLPPLNAEDDKLISDFAAHFTNREDELAAMLDSPLERFPPDPRPFIVTTWMRSGTTLTQQLLYQILVLNGRVPTDPTGKDYFDINEAMPYIEMYQTREVKPTHDHSPSILKTHLHSRDFHAPQWDEARFIVVVRDARAAMRSVADYNAEWAYGIKVPEHLRAHLFDRMVRLHMLGCEDAGRGAPSKTPHRWFDHTHGWLTDERVRDRALYVTYDELVEDMPAAVRKLAAFIGVPCSDEVVAEVVRRSQREEMQGETRFMSRVYAKRFGMGELTGLKVRPKGTPGFVNALSEATEKDYREAYKTAFGVETYAELREIFNERNSRKQ